MKVVAVIPAYNESTRVTAAILDAHAHVDAVVVVDDCSRDDTREAALKTPAHVLRHEVNRGQGAALQTGTDFAFHELKADAVVHFDADGQMQGKDIPSMIEPIMQGEADVVLGSRFMGMHAEGMPRTRRATLKMALIFTRLVSGIQITDPHCGFRAISRRAVPALRMRQDRMSHASEMLDLIKTSGLTFVSRPVKIRYTEETLEKGMSFFDGFQVLREYFIHKFF